jgi:hypothetical protein
MDRGECLVCQPAQIDTADFGPESTARQNDHRFVSRRTQNL